MTPANLSEQAKSRRRRAIGRHLSAMREGLNQTELGIKLGDYSPTGQPVPQTTISRWERGTVDLTLEDAYEIEVALRLAHGTLARAGGYVEDAEPASTAKSVEEMLRVDPNLDPDLRQDVITAYRSYVTLSRRLNREEATRSAPQVRRRSAV